MQSVAELRSEIEAAWADAVYPGDREVYAGYENEEWIGREMVGKDWRDVDPAAARWFASGDNLQLTKPRAIAYFIPAFMLADLGYADMPLFNILAPPLPKYRDDAFYPARFQSRITLFNEEQLHAIAMYFAYARKAGLLIDYQWDCVVEFYGKYLGSLAEELANID